MKVFISQPFHDRSETEIIRERIDILSHFKTWLGLPPDYFVELIDTYYKPYAPKNASKLWNLGDSIQLMDQADYVLFSINADMAPGCLVEYYAAKFYGKKNISIYWK